MKPYFSHLVHEGGLSTSTRCWIGPILPHFYLSHRQNRFDWNFAQGQRSFPDTASHFGGNRRIWGEGAENVLFLGSVLFVGRYYLENDSEESLCKTHSPGQFWTVFLKMAHTDSILGGAHFVLWGRYCISLAQTSLSNLVSFFWHQIRCIVITVLRPC